MNQNRRRYHLIVLNLWCKSINLKPLTRFNCSVSALQGSMSHFWAEKVSPASGNPSRSPFNRAPGQTLPTDITTSKVQAQKKTFKNNFWLSFPLNGFSGHSERGKVTRPVHLKIQLNTLTIHIKAILNDSHLFRLDVFGEVIRLPSLQYQAREFPSGSAKPLDILNKYRV